MPAPMIPLLRPPNDDFTFNLFKQLCQTLSDDTIGFYTWTNPPQIFEGFTSNADFSTHKNVILGIKDLMDLWIEYDPWERTQQPGIEHLEKIIRKFPDTNFVLVTSYESIDRELKDIPNLQIVYWGGDIVNQAAEYPTLKPVLDKNFESPTHYISLNRNVRAHRILALSYLFGKGYDKHGHLTFLGKSRENYPEDFLDIISWRFSDHHSEVRDAVINGYKILSERFDNTADDYDIYHGSENNNACNFKYVLSDMYRNSFVEIVSETTFASPAYMITEKTLNSVYGCNFPILLSGVGAIAHLREIGFDVFDDIVDHSYDNMVDPIDRVVAAFELNKRLLTDSDYVKTQWTNCKPRFESNLEVAKNMYSWFDTRARDMFKNIVWK